MSLAPIINLTSPNKKSNKSPNLDIEGHGERVVRMRKRHAQIESLKTEQELDKDELMEAVKSSRLEAEEEGEFYRIALVKSADDTPAKVIFKNMFKQIDIGHESELRKYLKKGYDPLFETRYSVKLRNNKSVERLRELLGNDLDLLFEVTPFVSPVDDFMEKRAQLRPTLDKKVNATVDNVTDQAQYQPQINLK